MSELPDQPYRSIVEDSPYSKERQEEIYQRLLRDSLEKFKLCASMPRCASILSSIERALEEYDD